MKSQALERRALDFVAFFNALWYRDFPVTPRRLDIGKRALWTTHVASAVKQSADLLGLFTCFETGGKTDAVIEDAGGARWAKVEWEWYQARNEQVNELRKLVDSVDEAKIFVFIGYSRTDRPHHEENIQRIADHWRECSKPLLAMLVTFRFEQGRRCFGELQTHLFQNGRHRLLRTQPALPWEVSGTKWCNAD